MDRKGGDCLKDLALLRPKRLTIKLITLPNLEFPFRHSSNKVQDRTSKRSKRKKKMDLLTCKSASAILHPVTSCWVTWQKLTTGGSVGRVEVAAEAMIK